MPYQLTSTDADYQTAVFDTYTDILKRTALWSTIGNHDTAGSTAPPASLPYYMMMTLPQNGEAGGVPSGTEDYYSFDYGNIHFICLDSMTSDRSPTGPMLTWLQNDLNIMRKCISILSRLQMLPFGSTLLYCSSTIFS